MTPGGSRNRFVSERVLACARVLASVSGRSGALRRTTAYRGVLRRATPYYCRTTPYNAVLRRTT
eukprot:8256198-Alexandrium_andersonii.AAC.1